MCGPLVEVVSMKTEATRPAYGADDVDATDTVQLLHRTVKDFLASYDLAGPLSFNEEDAIKFVKDTLRTYARIVLPPVSTRYVSLATSENSNWAQTIENVATYLSDKRLLPWIFDTLFNNISERPKLLGIFHSLLQESAFPQLGSWTELELEREFGLHIEASSGLESAKSIISAHYVEYACSNGYTIAVKAFLEIISLEESLHVQFAVFDAALMVAIKYEMLDLVETFTKVSRYESECRFWEEDEYNLMGVPYYLTPFEMAAAQTGNEAVATAVYDRNHNKSKQMPWPKWGFLSRGRKHWRRTREDWIAFLEFTRESKSSRQALESSSFGHVREAIQAIVDYGKRSGFFNAEHVRLDGPAEELTLQQRPTVVFQEYDLGLIGGERL
jgi:hypothetical protein